MEGSCQLNVPADLRPEKEPHLPVCRRLVGPLSRSESKGEEIKSQSMLEIKRLSSSPYRSQYTDRGASTSNWFK